MKTIFSIFLLLSVQGIFAQSVGKFDMASLQLASLSKGKVKPFRVATACKSYEVKGRKQGSRRKCYSSEFVEDNHYLTELHSKCKKGTHILGRKRKSNGSSKAYKNCLNKKVLQRLAIGETYEVYVRKGNSEVPCLKGFSTYGDIVLLEEKDYNYQSCVKDGSYDDSYEQNQLSQQSQLSYI